mmetsp:Transcript_28492/g.37261  ORF Transcript_28492/g.37261 Transcript_28492/m.37261 type:complete len:264 (-) Transcript_28492:308-1099(-)|eukprot:CAMPEP_0117746650 /NCGR_PEP_ID=MMETSP0947-20121206/8064_1 /TAXON_ID=44440 /ORGANISM="Chattonella subsalsa, Strain CCMP2191" /LENGTH=263 /DNA_ID=CAMNT_0005563997 /DNA_START=132 /DNA_END=923 /DNA_ORIENTATION=+
MPQYGLFSYWDNRYENDFPEPFDWLFSYSDLAALFAHTIDKHAKILIIGCGNAEMSSDMFADGYENQVNMDTCEIVIKQQQERHPYMRWEVADVTDMHMYADGEYDVVLDKSLIDTMLCYENAHNVMNKMMEEIHRVLRSGGRYLCLSLHTADSAMEYLTQDKFSFYPHVAYLPNPRFSAGKDKNRTTTFTVIVCDKYPDGLPIDYQPPPLDKCALNEKQARNMKAKAERYFVDSSIQTTSIDDLMRYFEIGLTEYSMHQGWD